MSTAFRNSTNRHGEPVLTVTVSGPDDVYRFSHHLLLGQCEFADIGYASLRSLRRRLGPIALRWLNKSMQGIDSAKAVVYK